MPRAACLSPTHVSGHPQKVTDVTTLYEDMGTASWSLAFIYHNHNIAGGDVMVFELFVLVYSQDLLLLHF